MDFWKQVECLSPVSHQFVLGLIFDPNGVVYVGSFQINTSLCRQIQAEISSRTGTGAEPSSMNPSGKHYEGRTEGRTGGSAAGRPSDVLRPPTRAESVSEEERSEKGTEHRCLRPSGELKQGFVGLATRGNAGPRSREEREELRSRRKGPNQRGAGQKTHENTRSGLLRNSIACVCRDSEGRLVESVVKEIKASSPLMAETLEIGRAHV